MGRVRFRNRLLRRVPLLLVWAFGLAVILPLVYLLIALLGPSARFPETGPLLPTIAAGFGWMIASYFLFRPALSRRRSEYEVEERALERRSGPRQRG